MFSCTRESTADLDPERVENDDGIHPVQCPALAYSDLIQHGIRHPADQVGRNIQAINFFKMGSDIRDC